MLRSTPIAVIPDHALLTESDGRFLKAGNVGAEPAGMGELVSQLAGLRSMSPGELDTRIVQNFGRAVDLAPPPS